MQHISRDNADNVSRDRCPLKGGSLLILRNTSLSSTWNGPCFVFEEFTSATILIHSLKHSAEHTRLIATNDTQHTRVNRELKLFESTPRDCMK